MEFPEYAAFHVVVQTIVCLIAILNLFLGLCFNTCDGQCYLSAESRITQEMGLLHVCEELS